MYELTALLTVIATCSATIVAILGGFIASRLITLNAERQETEARIALAKKESEFTKSHGDRIKEALDIEDALCFIDDHIGELLDKKEFKEFDENLYKSESMQKLEAFWNQALEVLRAANAIREKGENASEFEKEVLDMLIKENNRRIERSRPLGIPLSTMSRMNGIWYQKQEDKYKELSNRNEWLSIQLTDLEIKKNSLQKPRGMISGIVIFALFSIFGLILPMTLISVKLNDYRTYTCIKVVFIVIFSLGIISVILYLITMVKWGRQKSSGNLHDQNCDWYTVATILWIIEEILRFI